MLPSSHLDCFKHSTHFTWKPKLHNLAPSDLQASLQPLLWLPLPPQALWSFTSEPVMTGHSVPGHVLFCPWAEAISTFPLHRVYSCLPLRLSSAPTSHHALLPTSNTHPLRISWASHLDTLSGMCTAVYFCSCRSYNSSPVCLFPSLSWDPQLIYIFPSSWFSLWHRKRAYHFHFIREKWNYPFCFWNTVYPRMPCIAFLINESYVRKKRKCQGSQKNLITEKEIQAGPGDWVTQI